jgi:hypothetical protein
MGLANLAPVLKHTFVDANGAPLVGGKLYSYVANTSTPAATYSDDSEDTHNANPTILDANGQASIWISGAQSYKFVLKDANDVTQWTIDNVTQLGTGPTGASFLFGAGVPDDEDDGEDGDAWLDTDTGDMYRKDSGAWGSPVESFGVFADAVAAAEAAQAAAEAAQAAAQTAETNAETAETNAETAETNAETAQAAAATSASNAATFATNAATSATNAATSATAAQTAENNAETAETNAETAETNAAASAAAAAASAAAAAAAVATHEADTTNIHGIADTSALATKAGTEVLTNKDYDGGTASNARRITVPSAAKATLDGLTRKAGTIVFATDTLLFYYDNGTNLVPPGGGGGTALLWHIEAGSAPIEAFEYGHEVLKFTADGRGVEKAFATYKVPDSYVAGSPIHVKVGAYSPSSSNTILMQITGYLIRKNTDAVDSSTNSETSPNSALTNNLANEYQEFDCNMTADASGKLNNVSVAPGDVLLFILFRGTDTDTEDIRVIKSASEVTLT